MTAFTPHYRFGKPDFNTNTWHQALDDNFDALDALIWEGLAIAGLTGVWDNSQAYNIGNRVVDPDNAGVYTCLVPHTSSATSTFEEDRVAHPTYWVAASLVLTPRGAWAKNTVYNAYDIAYQISEGVAALCLVTHTSSNGGGDTIRTDAANWAFIIDLAGGTINADDVPYDNVASGLVADNAQDALDEIVASLLLKATIASPVFTGSPAGPTPATSDNSTKLATTAYVVNKLATAGVLTNFSVRVATTGNVNLANELENGDTIDGIVLATGNRVLVKSQTLPAQNGIYVVPASGAASRATDADTWDEHIGMIANVAEGTLNEGLSFRSLVNAGGTLGVTAIDFQQFGGSIQLPLAIADGGTGSQTEANARDALGLEIGVDVQAFDTQLAQIAALAIVGGDILYGSAANTISRLAKGDDGQVLTLAGGVPTWAAKGSNAPHVILEDQKAQGTNGQTLTSGADRTRDLNTEVLDSLGICSLASNQFTLAAGTYYIEWSAPAGINCAQTQSWLYDVTSTTVLKRGTSAGWNASSNMDSRSVGHHVFTIGASHTFEIRQRVSGNGEGGHCGNFGTELYTFVKIWKEA